MLLRFPATPLILIVLCVTRPGGVSADNSPLDYSPAHGDVIFQSLHHSPVVDAIEDATGSPYSHVGIVVQEGGGWYVLEALGRVKETPLRAWTRRGRGGKFDVYRLVGRSESELELFVDAARGYLGRPYDRRYRWDDETIYCSELLYKAYQASTGAGLGELVHLGDLGWQRHIRLIKEIEHGDVPLDRLMITPRGLSESPRLRLVHTSP